MRSTTWRPRPCRASGARQSSMSSTQSSAVGSWRCSRSSRAPCRRRQQSVVHHPEGGVREGGLALRDGRPLSVVANLCVEPGEEAGRAVRRVGERRRQLREALALCLEPRRLRRGRRGQPRELGEGCEVPLPHHGGDARIADRRAEQLVDELPAGPVSVLAASPSTPGRTPGAAGRAPPRAAAPDLEQVVALVEDKGQLVLLLQPLTRAPAVRVQAVQQAALPRRVGVVSSASGSKTASDW